MATLNTVLLGAALCIGAALSLRCYQCLTPGTDGNCNNTITCKATETFCETISSTNSTGHESVYKSCAATYREGQVFISSLRSLSISCCRTDLCNRGSGAPGVTCSSALVSLCLAFTSLCQRNGWL
ncbi:lymphocyte antigen 6D-like [Xenopus tropicalis]|uniref:Lymphocyte antigen 6D-like n=1 Tax=Xenopus tropicalis TaxID=8364 RepID=A0A8J1JUL3_XENTR|nr:lymphocyte antigen 6D-like [Xenopus tropicalis]